MIAELLVELVDDGLALVVVEESLLVVDNVEVFSVALDELAWPGTAAAPTAFGASVDVVRTDEVVAEEVCEVEVVREDEVVLGEARVEELAVVDGAREDELVVMACKDELLVTVNRKDELVVAKVFKVETVVEVARKDDEEAIVAVVL